MNVKQWRMESAKLAVAYMEGGSTPFNAAKMARFKNVADMENAIDGLNKENESKEEKTFAIPKQAVVKLDPSGEYRSENFLIKTYPAQGNYPEMVRVFAGGRISYIYFEPEWAEELMKLLGTAAGVRHESEGTADEWKRLCEKREQELAKAHCEIERLNKCVADANEQLLQANERNTGKSNAELEALNQRLKDKLVEIVLGI